MDKRTFIDVMGTEWEVWEVYPRLVERRLQRERRAELRSGERRQVPVGRPTMPRQILGGWLAFQCRYERRRLLPVPDYWETMSDHELQSLLVSSKLSSRPRRPRG